jgi:hypothetical protein
MPPALLVQVASPLWGPLVEISRLPSPCEVLLWLLLLLHHISQQPGN